MTTPPKTIAQRHDDLPPAGMAPALGEESLGEQLLREAREGDAEFVAGWSKFMEELGVQGTPIGAKKLREMLLQTGTNPNANEFSRGIIAMREE